MLWLSGALCAYLRDLGLGPSPARRTYVTNLNLYLLQPHPGTVCSIGATGVHSISTCLTDYPARGERPETLARNISGIC